MLHAGDDLLPDIAALVEIDAAELVHQGFVRKGVVEGEVSSTLRHAEGDEVPDPRRLARIRRPCILEAVSGHERAPAERRQPRIRDGDAVAGLRALPPTGQHRPVGARVPEADLGAEPIGGEPLQELGRPRCRDVEEEARPAAIRRVEDEHVRDDLPLRSEKRAVPGAARRETVEIAGQETVEEGASLLARDLDHAAVAKVGHRHRALLGNGGGAPV